LFPLLSPLLTLSFPFPLLLILPKLLYFYLFPLLLNLPFLLDFLFPIATLLLESLQLLLVKCIEPVPNVALKAGIRCWRDVHESVGEANIVVTVRRDDLRSRSRSLS
jgi:hypothetical protein